MKNPRRTATILFLLAAASPAGCDDGLEDVPADQSDSEPMRGGVGKADMSGSCRGPEVDACGGQSAGSCWCDDSCVDWGDCCEDREAVCNPSPTPPVVDGPQEHPLLGVRILDSKALGDRPVFTIFYEFADAGLGDIEVSCNDDTATTTMTGAGIANGQELLLQGGDFYCFRLAALVRDLGDVTGGHQLPSFADETEADIHFDLSDTQVAVTFDIGSESTVVVHARLSDETYKFDAPSE